MYVESDSSYELVVDTTYSGMTEMNVSNYHF